MRIKSKSQANYLIQQSIFTLSPNNGWKLLISLISAINRTVNQKSRQLPILKRISSIASIHNIDNCLRIQFKKLRKHSSLRLNRIKNSWQANRTLNLKEIKNGKANKNLGDPLKKNLRTEEATNRLRIPRSNLNKIQ